MSGEENEDCTLAYTPMYATIRTGEDFEIKSDKHLRLEKLDLLDDYPSENGKRLTVMANVKTNTLDKRETVMEVAIASLIVGKEYSTNIDLIIAPIDICKLTIIGAQVEIQLSYLKYTEYSLFYDC